MPEVDLAEKLNPRLTHFLANRLGWKQLNPIQEKAIPVIFEGKDTLVLAPTASGKTEAVLIPLFNEILNNKLEPTSVLYISPLKALINDMHNRIESWGNHFGITAAKWHGDVDLGKRNKYLKNPTDFLSITPESLEVIIMNKSSSAKHRIFQNVRYIIIDEIHYFADSDRGIQLNSIVNRISRYSNHDIQKLGLSATVGNPELIAEWMDKENPATIVKDDDQREFKSKILNIDLADFSKLINKIKNKKILIFVNSRAGAENIHYELVNNSHYQNVFIHHSSIDRDRREESEKKFKEAQTGIMISTTTLELGIDIGNIDTVIQEGPPPNISSFLQRIGRSGRRSKIQRAIIIAQDFEILQSLAVLMLTKEDSIEEIKVSDKSKDILFHQILSQTFELGKTSRKELYDNLHGCYSFSGITKKEFKILLDEMVRQDFIRLGPDKSVTLGYEFEEKFGKDNFMSFYSVFCPNTEYKLKEGRKEVGSIDSSFAIGLKPKQLFLLGGKTWRIKNIDHEDKIIRVQASRPKKNIPRWISDGPPISYLISRKIYDILLGNFTEEDLIAFGQKARKYLDKFVEEAQKSGFAEGIIPVEIIGNRVYINTFAGDKANNLLSYLFRLYYDIYSVSFTPEYCSFMVKEHEISIEDIEEIMYNASKTLEDPESLLKINDEIGTFYKNKFINFLPEEDEIKLKMHLLFDQEGLLDVIENNTLVLIHNNSYRKLFEKDKDKMEQGKKLMSKEFLESEKEKYQ